MTTDSPSACAPSLFVGAVSLARSDACQQIRLVGDRTGWLGQQGSNFCIRIVPPWAYRYRAARRVADDRAPDSSRRVHNLPSAKHDSRAGQNC